MENLLASDLLFQELCQFGVNFYVGVPDSVVRKLIDVIQNSDYPYISATCEDVAVGVGAGAYLSGMNPCIIIQNSGLGNATDTIITLNNLYKIPLLFIISWRGYNEIDEIQHIDWGNITLPLLDLLEMKYYLIDIDNFHQMIEEAIRVNKNLKKSSAIIIRRGYLNEER